MVILEPDGTVSNDGWGAQPQAEEPLNELAAAVGTALDHIHYSFDVPGIGLVALQLDRELAAPVLGQPFVLMRSGQG